MSRNKDQSQYERRPKRARLSSETAAIPRPFFSDENHKFARSVYGDIRHDSFWIHKTIYDDYAAELLELHEGSLDIEQRLKELVEGEDLPVGSKSRNGHATYLGCQVICQNNTIAIDWDSERNPKTITTAETRDFSRYCIDQVLNEDPYFVGTGQPGIGKTRGALTYSLQTLLHLGKTVIRAGFKDNLALLFVPRKRREGQGRRQARYKVFKGSTMDLPNCSLNSIEFREIIALIDPPEEGVYSNPYTWRRLKFAPNNRDRHFTSDGKSSSKSVMRIPTLSSVQVMAQEVWTPEMNSLLANGQKQNIQVTDKDEIAIEVARRCSLVGCIPQAIFNDDFQTTLLRLYKDCRSTMSTLTIDELKRFFKGVYRLNDFHNNASVTSKVFLINPKVGDRKSYYLSMNPLSLYCATARLREQFSTIDGSVAFQFESICAMLLKGGNWGKVTLPPLRSVRCGANWENTSKLIKALGDHGRNGELIRAANCYPILDYASAITTWYNAEVGDLTPTVSLCAFCRVMILLDLATFADGKLIVRDPSTKITLYFVRNTEKTDEETYRVDERNPTNDDTYPGFQPSQVRDIFEQYVSVKTLHVDDWTRKDMWTAQNEHTEKLLRLYLSDDEMNP